MNNTLRLTLATALIVATQGTFAHDPAEHAKEAADAKKGADCAAMKDMDMSRMDPNDVVMKAMMAKCSAAKKPAETSGAKAGHDMKGMDTTSNPSKSKPDTHESH